MASNRKITNNLIRGFSLFFFVSVIAVLFTLYISSSYSTATIEEKLSSITGLWNLLLGLPITAAGAIIAIMLAQKSIDISKTQEHLEEQSLQLNSKLAEYEFKQSLTLKWEESVHHYVELNEGIQALTDSLSKLKYWHQKPKNHLSIYGAELSSSTTENIQLAFDNYQTDETSAEKLQTKITVGFNCFDCPSLSISNNELVFDEDKNKELAFEHNKSFYEEVEEQVIASLHKVELALIAINKCGFTTELWKEKYRQHLANNSFMLDNALKHYDAFNCQLSNASDRLKFNSEVYQTPLKALEKVREYKRNLQTPSYSMKLFLLTSNIHPEANYHNNYLSLLDFIPIKKKNRPSSHFCGLPVSEDICTSSTPSLFWDELETNTIVRVEHWHSTGLLFFKDIVRMMPNEDDVLNWSKQQFTLSPRTQAWIKQDLSFDIKNIFLTNQVFVPVLQDELLDDIDLGNEEHQIELNTSAEGLFSQFIASAEYGRFLTDSFSSYSCKNISYKTHQYRNQLMKKSYAKNWEVRQPKSIEDEMIIAGFKSRIDLMSEEKIQDSPSSSPSGLRHRLRSNRRVEKASHSNHFDEYVFGSIVLFPKFNGYCDILELVGNQESLNDISLERILLFKGKTENDNGHLVIDISSTDKTIFNDVDVDGVVKCLENENAVSLPIQSYESLIVTV